MSVWREGRAGFAPAGATFTLAGGRLTALTGPSGCGKTTLLSALPGFAELTVGTIMPHPGHGSASGSGPLIQNGRVVPVNPPRTTLAAGWVPQDPTLSAGTVADNIRLGWPDTPDEAVAAAARDAALDDVHLGRDLGERGTGLSSGQRRRVALARAASRGGTAAARRADSAREAAVIATLHCRAAAGDAVVVVTHHPALIAADDEVVDLAASAEPPPSPRPSRPPSPGRHRNARGGPGMIPRSDNSNRRGALPPAATEAAGLRATSRRSGGRFVPVWGTLSGPRSSGRPGEDIGALDSGNRRSVPPGSSLQLGREDNSNKRASAATESGARARRARRRRRAVPPGGTGLVPLRGDLAAATMQLLDGAAELAAFGADGRAFGTVQDKGGRVGEATIRSGSARGAGAAVSALAAGAAVCGVLAVAVPEVRADGLAGVLLAVVALTPLAAHVFDSTLEANLRLAKPSATAAELRSALARARLLIWVDSLPLGLATQVGEHGARLSSGQRLALARVLLRDLPVVILDEPAEHLDEATAEELTRALLSAVAGRTVTLITHRPVAPGSVDQVLRLNDGRLLPAVQAAWQPA